MAFIRDYAAESGDPFKLRKLSFKKIGRGLKKLGKNIATVAPMVAPVASFLPGVGGLVGSVTSRISRARQRLYNVADQYGVDPDALMEFARSYGYDMEGDPGPPKPGKRRKSAAAGPKAKAQKKREKRTERAARGPTMKKRGPATKAPPNIFEGVSLDPSELLRRAGAKLIPGLAGGAAKGLGFGGRRRSINPANVKALRRGIRRLEGFEKLVARVHKSMPRTRALINRARGSRGGHRAGCRCVACKRAA